ncbi:hypothetical protein GEW_12861, partial [Pasteurella multocida subsp. gallicida str. Anand1_poultry]
LDGMPQKSRILIILWQIRERYKHRRHWYNFIQGIFFIAKRDS